MKRVLVTTKSGFRLVAQGILEAYEDESEIGSFQERKLHEEMLELERTVNAHSPSLRLHIELADGE